MKFSIIVPVYNVEQYLAECLDSLLSQTYEDYEIICINDASTDKSYDILLEYSDNNKCIKVLNNDSNQGQSYSRNRGIKEAVGEYVLFVDSDDMLCPDALSILNETIEENEVEMVCYRYLVKLEGKVAKEKNTVAYEEIVFDDDIKTGQRWFMEMAERSLFFVAPWTYLSKREFLLNNSLLFYEGIIHEDVLYMFQCILVVSKIKYIHKFIYINRARDNSTTSTMNEFRLDSLIIALGKILTLWHNCTLEEGMDDAIKQYMEGWMPAIYKMCVLFPKHNKMAIGTSADQFLYDLCRKACKQQHRYVQLQDSEIKHINKYDKIIVYGAGNVAAELILYLETYHIHIEAVAVSDKSINLPEIYGIPIFQAEELVGMRENALVIIGIVKRNQKNVIDKLHDLGFKNIMAIDTDRIAAQ